MKKFYTLFIFSMITLSAFSQAYRPMLTNSSEWYYFELGLGWEGTTLYTVGGDTTIANIPYTKVSQTSLTSTGSLPDWTHFLKEDSLNRRVYTIAGNDSMALLYDFNLLPGDTFNFPPAWGGGSLILDSISNDFNQLIVSSMQSWCIPDSSNNSIALPKIFYFNNNVIWIEGVGSLGDLISRAYLSFNCVNYLSCHYNKLENKDIHISAWINQLDGECVTFTTGVNSLNNDELFVFISPNPSTGESISISGEDLRLIKIYTIQGQLVKTIEVENDETLINLKNEPKGIYLIKVQFENGKITTKKLIIN